MITQKKSKKTYRKVDPAKAAAKAEMRARMVQGAKELKEQAEADTERRQQSLQSFWEMVDRITFERGKPYSINNFLLIYMYCPHASKLHTYPQWQQLGFQVQKDEIGIVISAPNSTEDKEEEDEEWRPRMHDVTLFDISQVKPIETTTGEVLMLGAGPDSSEEEDEKEPVVKKRQPQTPHEKIAAQLFS